MSFGRQQTVNKSQWLVAVKSNLLGIFQRFTNDLRDLTATNAFTRCMRRTYGESTAIHFHSLYLMSSAFLQCSFLVGFFSTTGSLNDKPLEVLYNICGMLHIVFHHCQVLKYRWISSVKESDIFKTDHENPSQGRKVSF